MKLMEGQNIELKEKIFEAIRKMIIATDGLVFEDMRSLEQELTFVEANKVFEQKGIPFTKMHMQTLGLLDMDGIYTNLALLLSDQCPHIIKAAIFRDETQNSFQSRKEFSGSLFKQLEDAYTYIDMANNLRSTFKGLSRIDKRDYPESAVREALLNSIVHRDYSIMANTLIKIYSNRIEYISYGGLMPNVDEKDILLGFSVCRNPKLANIFYRLDFIEAYGTGIPKITESYEQYAVKPEFISSPNVFKVVLPNTHTNDLPIKACEPQEVYGDYDEDNLVYTYISEHYGSSKSEIVAEYGFSDSKVVRILRRLLDAGKITRIGKGKNIRYKI